MGNLKKISCLFLLLLSFSSLGREIVVGIEKRPVRKMAIILTPIVVPDLISLKTAFEYSPYRKISIIWPIEAKWMDYRYAIKLGAKLGNGPNDIPEKWYKDNRLTPGWNIDIMQFKVSSGLGLKYFPFSQMGENGFFLKTLFLAGAERFNAYSSGEGKVDSAVLTHVLSLGYTWVWQSGFLMGAEFGEEYIYHTNPIKGLPDLFFKGFNPIIHFNLGLTF